MLPHIPWYSGIIPADPKAHLSVSEILETVKWIAPFCVVKRERIRFILSSAIFREWEIGFDYYPDCRNAAVL